MVNLRLMPRVRYKKPGLEEVGLNFLKLIG